MHIPSPLRRRMVLLIYKDWTKLNTVRPAEVWCAKWARKSGTWIDWTSVMNTLYKVPHSCCSWNTKHRTLSAVKPRHKINPTNKTLWKTVQIVHNLYTLCLMVTRQEIDKQMSCTRFLHRNDKKLNLITFHRWEQCFLVTHLFGWKQTLLTDWR